MNPKLIISEAYKSLGNKHLQASDYDFINDLQRSHGYINIIEGECTVIEIDNKKLIEKL